MIIIIITCVNQTEVISQWSEWKWNVSQSQLKLKLKLNSRYDEVGLIIQIQSTIEWMIDPMTNDSLFGFFIHAHSRGHWLGEWLSESHNDNPFTDG